MKAKKILLLIPFLLLMAGCHRGGEVKVLKLAHGLDPAHPVHKAMVYMGERLAEKSGGTMRIDIYPSQQLGTEREAMELVQIGSLAMAKTSVSVMENFAPRYQVLGLPFIFDDEAHRFAVFDGPIGEEILRSSESIRLLGLCFYDAGNRSFYTVDRPIRTPEDLAGMKIRVQESQTSMRMVSELGGSPTPISFGELYTALQQGVVDGAENNPPSFYTSRHYEVAKYYTLNEHTGVPDVLLISTPIWDELTPQQQQWVQEAADESAEYQKVLWEEATEEALQAVQEAGVEVIRPDKGLFREKVADVLESYRNQPELYDLIQRIQAVGEENGESG